jgi:hypothetical protein
LLQVALGTNFIAVVLAVLLTNKAEVEQPLIADVELAIEETFVLGHGGLLS